jgi:hypothetical protein
MAGLGPMIEIIGWRTPSALERTQPGGWHSVHCNVHSRPGAIGGKDSRAFTMGDQTFGSNPIHTSKSRQKFADGFHQR